MSISVESRGREITHVKIINFKSINKLELKPSRINIFIGKNASGKSNIIDAFRFLRDTVSNGIQQAVMRHGGNLGVGNIQLGQNSTEIGLGGKINGVIRTKEKEYKINGFSYSICFQVLKTQNRVKIKKETLMIDIGADEENQRKITYTRNSRGKIKKSAPKEFPFLKHTIDELPHDVTFLQIPLNIVFFIIREFIENDIQLFDLNVKQLKDMSPIGTSVELLEDGSNLPSVIKFIVSKEESKREFLNNVKFALPYIREVGTQHIMGSLQILTVKEEYSNDHLLAAPVLSEGTINIIGLIVAIKHQRSNIVIIEEPERFVHPSILHKIMDLIIEETNKQFIITTHSPELVKNVDPSSVFLVGRKNGFTVAKRAEEDQVVHSFIEGGFTLGDLMVDDVA